MCEIVECLLTTPSCMKNSIIPKDTISAFQSAQLSASTSKLSLKSTIRGKMKGDRLTACNQKLQGLSVQGKFLNVVHLEEDTRVWNRIISGLPKNQLSFLLRAGSDTLPSHMNLCRWKLRVEWYMYHRPHPLWLPSCIRRWAIHMETRLCFTFYLP